MCLPARQVLRFMRCQHQQRLIPCAPTNSAMTNGTLSCGLCLDGRYWAGSVGVTAVNNRRFVDAVIHRYRTGTPWRDLPDSFGSWNNTHRRWSRWAKKGVWGSILAILSTDADNEYAMIDSTIVRAHQHSAGAKKKLRKIRRLGAARVA